MKFVFKLFEQTKSSLKHIVIKIVVVVVVVVVVIIVVVVFVTQLDRIARRRLIVIVVFVIIIVVIVSGGAIGVVIDRISGGIKNATIVLLLLVDISLRVVESAVGRLEAFRRLGEPVRGRR